MDHHCFFINNCVGYHNLRFFVMFCLWTIIGSGYAELIALTRLLQIGGEWNSRRANGLFAFLELLMVSAIFACIMPVVLLVISLLSKQFFNIYHNITEIERAKLREWRKKERQEGQKPLARSPFDRGFLKNLESFLGPFDIETYAMVAPTDLPDRFGIEFYVNNVAELAKPSFREIWGISSAWNHNTYPSSRIYYNHHNSPSVLRHRNQEDQLPKYFVWDSQRSAWRTVP